MRFPILAAALSFLFSVSVLAQDTEYRLWPGENPGGWEVEGPEQSDARNGIERVRNVNVPTITYYAPATKDPVLNRAAMIICPGGGYNILAIDHEGREIADWLASLGMHAYVLKYRLPKKGKNNSNWHVPVQDAQRAISLARQLATHFGYDTGKIGIMGFSAGGHLSAATSNAYEEDFEPLISFGQKNRRHPRSVRSYRAGNYDPSSHPDFTGLIYPAYLVGDLGNPSVSLSPEVQVRAQTPPAFLVHTEDDRVTALSSLYYYRELKAAGIPGELHVFPRGGHGYGLRDTGERVSTWPLLMEDWLRDLLGED